MWIGSAFIRGDTKTHIETIKRKYSQMKQEFKQTWTGKREEIERLRSRRYIPFCWIGLSVPESSACVIIPSTMTQFVDYRSV